MNLYVIGKNNIGFVRIVPNFQSFPKQPIILQVTEKHEPRIPYHWVEATVNVTVKEIPEEAVDKSGSIRFVNITAEEFIIPEKDVSNSYMEKNSHT